MPRPRRKENFVLAMWIEISDGWKVMVDKYLWIDKGVFVISSQRSRKKELKAFGVYTVVQIGVAIKDLPNICMRPWVPLLY